MRCQLDTTENLKVNERKTGEVQITEGHAAVLSLGLSRTAGAPPGAVGETEAAPSHSIKGQGEVTLRSLGIIDGLLQSITEKKNVPKYSDPRHKISPCEVNTCLKENLRTTCTLKDILKVKKKKNVQL